MTDSAGSTEGGQPKPHVLAMRRFLISSSSSSSAASTPPRRTDDAPPDDAGHPSPATGARNTSSLTSEASSVSTYSSSDTSSRHFSRHSTPPRLAPEQAAVEEEKVIPASPTAGVLAGDDEAEMVPVTPEVAQSTGAPQQRQRSKSDDSVESRDYVDELASSAFHDCQSAARTLYSTQGLLSFTDGAAAAVLTEGGFDSPSLIRGHPGEREASAVASSSAVLEASEPPVETIKASTSREAAQSAPATDGAGAAVERGAVEHPPWLTGFADAHYAPTVVPIAEPASPHSPLSGDVILPASQDHSRVDGNVSPDTSSSRHQVGVWKAIYGKERWADRRRGGGGCPGGEPVPSDDAATSHSDERDVSASVGSAVPDGEGQASATATSQWAATHRTALEMLRSRLSNSESAVGRVMGSEQKDRGVEVRREEVQQKQHYTDGADVPSSSILFAADDGPVVEAVVEERVPGHHHRELLTPVEEEGEAEVDAEEEKVEEGVGMPTPFTTGRNTSDTVAPVVTAHGALASSPPPQQQPHPRRTAEEVLAELMGGVLPASFLGTSSSAGHGPVAAPPSGSARMVSVAAHESLVEVSDATVPSPLHASRLVVRPALSADVSGISPIKNDAPSILVDMYDTPESRPERAESTPASGVAAPRVLGVASAARQEQTVGTSSALDFRTAQTAPTALSSRNTSLSSSALHYTPMQPVRGGGDARPAAQGEVGEEGEGVYEVAYTSSEVGTEGRVDSDGHVEEVQAAVREGLRRSQAASGLRPDARVSVFPPTNANAWDAARILSWRRRGEQQHQQQEQRGGQGEDNRETSSGGGEGVSMTFSNETGLTPAAALRRQRVREEMKAKELAECTFHPTLSPGTRAMVRMAQQREIEKSLHNTPPPPSSHSPSVATQRQSSREPKKGAAAEARVEPSLDPRTLTATLQNVYERLYPVELSAAASRRQILDQEMEYRRLAREEILQLRRKAGVVPRTGRTRSSTSRATDAFEAFMSDVLQLEWGTVAAKSPRLHGAGQTGTALVETSYVSPMAVALREEKEVRRRYHTRRAAEMEEMSKADTTIDGVRNDDRSGVGGTSAVNQSTVNVTGTEESFRIALFDEFLLRQNAYHFNRARSVRELERQLTPAFTPTTTDKSARLVKQMVSRSLLSESVTPETSTLIAQQQRRHIPVAASFVTQHQSPYRDPCTFQPQLSPAARAEKAAAARHRRQSKPDASASSQRKEFFDRLYGEHARLAKERETAREAAQAEEVAGLTFRPQLNASRNAQVKSVLNPQHFDQYQQYLQRKRQSLDERRQSQVSQAEVSEEAACTFRPQISKTPAYISKMAKSFGVLRQQDTEF